MSLFTGGGVVAGVIFGLRQQNERRVGNQIGYDCAIRSYKLRRITFFSGEFDVIFVIPIKS
jgi:hypothetical protein